MNKKFKLFIILLIPIILGVSLFGTYKGKYNKMIRYEANIEEAWSQVESNFQRRYDLIPNLVSTVQGSMKHEEKIFENITEARKKYSNASSQDQKINASQNLNQTIDTMVSVINESYPELASNNNVRDLMSSLEGTENRINVARIRYNEQVTKYNIYIKSFPNNIFANISGFEKKDLFEANEKAEDAPKVDFNL